MEAKYFRRITARFRFKEVKLFFDLVLLQEVEFVLEFELLILVYY